MVRSTKKHSNKDVDRRPHDRSKDIAEADMDDDEAVMDDDEAVVDDDEAVVDGFQRVSVLGLEVMTLDGPLRVRTITEPEGHRRTDRRG